MDKDNYKLQFKEIPIDQIQRDPDQPRKDFGTGGDENRLKVSIKKRGILEPIVVSEFEEGKFIIIDGHRRYIVAQELGFKSVLCLLYPKLKNGDLETSRFEIQNNQRRWKPLERSDALERIKAQKKIKTNRDLADLLGLSETNIANSLQLRKLALEYLALMAKYELSDSYQIEFMRLKPKIRKIGKFEVDDIIVNIFEKVQHQVIKNAKDFRKLGRIFLRATANEEAIFNFLSDPDMTIDILEQQTVQSGFSLLVEQLIQQIGRKKQRGLEFSEQEKEFLGQLHHLLNSTL